jgi:tetratricopeptide (TPR) repeat protein
MIRTSVRRTGFPVSVSIVCLLGAVACHHDGEAPPTEDPPPEVVSLLGEILVPPQFTQERKAKLEADLAEAQEAYDEDPDVAENIIWHGRRLGYLWRYRDAIEMLTRGLVLFPDDPRLYRHRGHRFITVREFERAVVDLEKASRLIEGRPDEIEPDGAPNEYGVPRSTLNSNVWYHLGLAYYLQGDFENARRCYERCMEFATVNDDMYVATADWLYMTYRRLGLEAEAAALLEPVVEDMEILENHAYHLRLRMYKGEVDPEALLDPAELDDLDLATQGYGVANWYLVNGDVERATALMEKVVDGRYWAAFGYVAAEADLARMRDEGGGAG